MARGVRLYLVGSVVLVSLAGCGRGFFQSAEREPWRAGADRQPAEMADPAAAASELSAKFLSAGAILLSAATNLSEQLSGDRAASAQLRRAVRSDLAERAGRRRARR